MWFQIAVLVLLLSARIELSRIADALEAKRPDKPADE